MHRRNAAPDQLAGDDAGFGLVEAIAAAFVLALFSAGIAGLILSTLKTSKIDRMRVAASSLAAREMEIVRDEFARSDASALVVVGAGTVTNANPLSGATNVVDGVTYTVKRTAAWAPNGTGASACDGGGGITYPSVRLNVTVTWSGMQGVRPITSSSIVTPTKRLLNSEYAFVAVKVNQYDAQPSPGRTVKSSGPAGAQTQTTDDSGCAVFGLATAGSYTFTLDEPGYVDYVGQPKPTVVRAVAKGSFTTFATTYDRAATLSVTHATEPGYALPSPLPEVMVRSAGLPSPGTRRFPMTGSPVLAGLLGPYEQGYTVWAGACKDSEPAASPTLKTVTAVKPGPGQTLAVTAFLAPVQVDAGAVGAGRVVTAEHVAPCTGAATTLSLGTLDGAGLLSTSLPYGTWDLKLDGVVFERVTPAKAGLTEVNGP